MGRIVGWILDGLLALVCLVKIANGTGNIGDHLLWYGFLLIVALDIIQKIVKAKQSKKV